MNAPGCVNSNNDFRQMCHAEEKVKRKASVIREQETLYKLRINCMKHQNAIIVRYFVKCRGNIEQEHDVAENFNAWV